MPDLLNLSFWPFILILGYPVLAIAVLEFARYLAGRAPFAASVFRQISYDLLPTGAIWLILRVLAELPADNWGVCGRLRPRSRSPASTCCSVSPRSC
jgi:hypothetical protein